MEKEKKEDQPLTPQLFKLMTWVADGKMYRTEGAAVLARKLESILAGQRETYLLRSPKGSYFQQSHTRTTIKILSIGTNDVDEIKPLNIGEALDLYNHLPEKLMPMDEAFPGLEEA